MRLLLLSNSTNPGEAYLEYAIGEIRKFLGLSIKTVVFVPFAGVTINWDDYSDKVSSVFSANGYKLIPIHQQPDPLQAILDAEAIVVGGGNTWQLLHQLYEKNLVAAIRAKVLEGTPYIGWSAGSNIACPTLKTTNDMPIVAPRSFVALDLIPFQINPHFIDIMPAGHAGETREDRLREFIKANPHTTVVGLREGTLLKRDKREWHLVGPHNAKIFRYGHEPRFITEGQLEVFWEISAE